MYISPSDKSSDDSHTSIWRFVTGVLGAQPLIQVLGKGPSILL